MIIDELIAVLGFDVKGEENLQRFNDGLKRVEAGLSGFVSRIAEFGRKTTLAISAIGVGIGATVAGMFKLASSASKPLDDLLKFSNRVGGSIEELQQWQYAAGLAGASSGEFQTSVISMTRQLAEAARGTGRAKKALADYGLSAKDAKGKIKEPTAFLMELSDKFQKLSDAKQLDLGTKLGLSPGMITLLKSGRAEIEKVQKQVRENGLVFTEEDAKKAEAFNDQMTLFQETIKALRWRIGVQLMPVLTEMMGKFQGWYTANESLIRQNVGDWTKRAVSGLETALGSLGRYWWALGKIADGMGALLKRLTGENIDVSKLQALAAIGAVLARIFAPVYFTIAAILLMVDDFIGYMRGDKSVFGALVQMIQELTGLPTGGAETIAGIVAGLGALVLIKANPINLLSGAISGLSASLATLGGAAVARGAAILAGLGLFGLGAAAKVIAEYGPDVAKKGRDPKEGEPGWWLGINPTETREERLDRLNEERTRSRGGPLSRGRRDRGEIERESSLDDFLQGPPVRPVVEQPTIRPDVETPTVRAEVDQPTILPQVRPQSVPIIKPDDAALASKKLSSVAAGILSAGEMIKGTIERASAYVADGMSAYVADQAKKGDRVAPQEPDPARFGGEETPKASGMDQLRSMLENMNANLAKMTPERAVQATVTDARQDNRQFPVTVNSTVNQTVTQAAQAPAAAARATSSAVGRAAVPQANRLKVDSAF